MPKYRVTLHVSSTEIIEADNPFQAAVIASDRHGDGVEIADVRPAVGRQPGSGSRPTTKKAAKKSTKKVAKKRRPLSPEARARLAQNLVKARAARAAKRKVAKRAPAKKKSTKKARAAKKR